MEKQDINGNDVTIAHNTRKKNARQYEPCKTSFFRLDKNYLPREFDKTNKVLPLSQKQNIPTGKNETLYFCDVCVYLFIYLFIYLSIYLFIYSFKIYFTFTLQ